MDFLYGQILGFEVYLEKKEEGVNDWGETKTLWHGYFTKEMFGDQTWVGSATHLSEMYAMLEKSILEHIHAPEEGSN